MVGRPQGLTARDIVVTTRLTRSEAAQLDRRRGDLARSDYLRRLIRRDNPERTEDA